ncbi:MAG TPA: hypothetical protein VMG11_04890 [Steroidobacteraceae bacterium]|nr:hypothetical protein [Steroidobacteraceae bacterium]
MKLYSQDNSELMRIDAIQREGDELIIKGKVFGAMPMTAKLRPDEARSALKLLDAKLVLFLLTFLFRRSRRGSSGR